jgi:Na+-translocating ferredoxin:NAD+ oxidoreductase RnfC subunit
MYCYRRIPVDRLTDKLGLAAYRDYEVPLNERDRKPKEVRIPLKQHIGVPSRPKVKAGASVTRGELIASIPRGKLGANVHASIDGDVAEVTETHVRITASG